MRFVGIDISKRHFHAAVLVDGKVERKTCPNSETGFKEFLEWLARRGKGESVHACMEATGTYGEALALALVGAGQVVSVVNPKSIHNFAKTLNMRGKTDELDAVLIARYAEALRPAPWSPPVPAIQELRQLLRRRDELVRMRTQEQNRLGAGSLHPLERASLERTLTHLAGEIAAIEALLREHVRGNPQLAADDTLLQTLPGIGEKSSWIFMAKLGPVETYESAKQVAAFLGVSPREVSSGSSVRGKTRMCKVGDPTARRTLYMAAMSAKQRDPAVQGWARRLQERGKAPKAVLCAIMRKLVHLAYGVLKHRKPYDVALAFG